MQLSGKHPRMHKNLLERDGTLAKRTDEFTKLNKVGPWVRVQLASLIFTTKFTTTKNFHQYTTHPYHTSNTKRKKRKSSPHNQMGGCAATEFLGEFGFASNRIGVGGGFGGRGSNRLGLTDFLHRYQFVLT